MSSAAFDRFAGVCALFVGVAGLVYSATFVAVLERGSSTAIVVNALFLLLGGLASTAVVLALYARLRATDPMFALWAALLGIVAALGSAVHGAFDLAVQIGDATRGGLPNPADPRGFMTFGLSALAVTVVAALMRRSEMWPARLALLGFALGALLAVIYLGRLILVDPTNPALLVAALVTGFLVNPAWYLWIGALLGRGPRTDEVSPPAPSTAA